MHLPQPQEEAHKTFRCIIEQVGRAGLKQRRGRGGHPGRTTPNAKRIYGSTRPICLWRLICCGVCGCVEEGEESRREVGEGEPEQLSSMTSFVLCIKYFYGPLLHCFIVEQLHEYFENLLSTAQKRVLERVLACSLNTLAFLHSKT